MTTQKEIMDKDIIDPQIRQRMMNENAERVRFQDTQSSMVQHFLSLWNSTKEVEFAEIENDYYRIQYSVKTNYNQYGNRIMIINKKKIQGYNFENITNIIKKNLDIPI
tara:strand:- start:1275 stop:1598 length:324 start_codon:yes stop_codon:yes gene_type:complete